MISARWWDRRFLSSSLQEHLSDNHSQTKISLRSLKVQLRSSSTPLEKKSLRLDTLKMVGSRVLLYSCQPTTSQHNSVPTEIDPFACNFPDRGSENVWASGFPLCGMLTKRLTSFLFHPGYWGDLYDWGVKKRLEHSLNLTNHQINANIKHIEIPLTSVRMATNKQASLLVRMWKKEILYIIGRIVNRCSH